MISERQIAMYGGFWASLTPMMEDFVRMVNATVVDEALPAIDPHSPGPRRAFVNELGFEIFALQQANPDGADKQPPLDTLLILATKVAAKIAQLEPGSESANAAFSDDEADEAMALATRLRLLVRPLGAPVVTKVHLPGCGFIGDAYADIVAKTTLCEVKAGLRSFRSTDVRQLLTYAALNHACGLHSIDTLALVNPRVGTVASMNLDDFAQRTADVQGVELLNRVVFAFSNYSFSR